MINGVSQGMMGERLSGNLNAAWADSPWQFLKLMLLAMSASWYLYALGLFFLFARVFRDLKLPLLLVAVALNYAAVANIIPGWEWRVSRSILSSSCWDHFTVRS